MSDDVDLNLVPCPALSIAARERDDQTRPYKCSPLMQSSYQEIDEPNKMRGELRDRKITSYCKALQTVMLIPYSKRREARKVHTGAVTTAFAFMASITRLWSEKTTKITKGKNAEHDRAPTFASRLRLGPLRKAKLMGSACCEPAWEEEGCGTSWPGEIDELDVGCDDGEWLSMVVDDVECRYKR